MTRPLVTFRACSFLGFKTWEQCSCSLFKNVIFLTKAFWKGQKSKISRKTFQSDFKVQKNSFFLIFQKWWLDKIHQMNEEIVFSDFDQGFFMENNPLSHEVKNLVHSTKISFGSERWSKQISINKMLKSMLRYFLKKVDYLLMHFSVVQFHLSYGNRNFQPINFHWRISNLFQISPILVDSNLSTRKTKRKDLKQKRKKHKILKRKWLEERNLILKWKTRKRKESTFHSFERETFSSIKKFNFLKR